jgi:NAD(P)-dependent dehydrogenase (short-subunit alcohol dehydrogenase family)
MLKNFRIDGATALITGAGTGMGAATARLFAVAGAKHLFLAGRRQNKLTATADAIKKETPTCSTEIITCDVASTAERQRLITAITNAGSGIDFLINNAGVFEGAALADTSDSIWERAFAVNSTAPFALLRDLELLLSQSPRPAVVNISSTIAVKPIPNAVAYNASKAALIQTTRTLALELGPKKIRVNCILPAVVDTPMYAGRFANAEELKSVLTSMASQHPLGRIGSVDDVAQAVLFLCSNAAAWITGVALPVDGGMLCT